MHTFLHFVLVIFLILVGSALLFFSIFGTELLKVRNGEKLEMLRNRYITIWLTAGVLILLGAFSMIVFSGNRNDNSWTKEEKDAMAKKIMESSIFVHGTGPDTAKLVSDCFIDKYTKLYTPKQMREQDKLSNEELSKLTSILMIECLKKYGLPRTDSSFQGESHKGSQPIQMHL